MYSLLESVFWVMDLEFSKTHTMLEHANEKGLISLSIPPIHWDLHVVNVRQRHIQFPVERRLWFQCYLQPDTTQKLLNQPWYETTFLTECLSNNKTIQKAVAHKAV